MMKVLIIGSKGFIGSYLYRYLKNFYLAYGSDLLEDMDDPNYFKLDEKFSVIDRLLQSFEFDYIINCAGSANVQKSFINPIEDFNLNVSLVIELSHRIIQYQKGCKFINISSAAVYGNPSQLPVSVESNLKPLSPYGVHKKLSDNVLHDYSKICALKSCSARIFSAYGENQRKLFLWDCFNKLLNADTSQVISFYGTGNESRDFIHISDIVRQIKLIMDNASFEGEVYNVANGEEVFIKDVVESMKSTLGRSALVIFTGQERPGDPLNWKADITPLQRWGYVKSVSMDDGIKSYVKWAIENA